MRALENQEQRLSRNASQDRKDLLLHLRSGGRRGPSKKSTPLREKVRFTFFFFNRFCTPSFHAPTFSGDVWARRRDTHRQKDRKRNQVDFRLLRLVLPSFVNLIIAESCLYNS